MMFSDEIRSKFSIDEPEEALGVFGHRLRLRQRLEKEGWRALKPREQMELLLFPVVPRQDLADQVQALADRFDTVNDLLDAPREALDGIPGVSGALADWLWMIGETVRVYDDARIEENAQLSCFREIRRHLKSWHPADETGLWVLYLDFGFELIAHERMGAGEDWWKPVNVRRMAEQAVAIEASCVVFVRYTDGAPDIDDFELSQLYAISHTMSALNVNIIDFVLCGGGRFRSLNREGKLDALREEMNDPAMFDLYLHEST